MASLLFMTRRCSSFVAYNCPGVCRHGHHGPLNISQFFQTTQPCRLLCVCEPHSSPDLSSPDLNTLSIRKVASTNAKLLGPFVLSLIIQSPVSSCAVLELGPKEHSGHALLGPNSVLTL